MSTHTKWVQEPWSIERTENTLWIGPLRIDGSGKCAVIVFSIPIGGLRKDVLDERLYTAARIVECVNALADRDPSKLADLEKEMECAIACLSAIGATRPADTLAAALAAFRKEVQ